MGFATLVLAGVASFFLYVIFSRRSPGYAWLWAALVSLIFLGAILYFAGGKALIGLASNTDGLGTMAPSADESDLLLEFAANAIGGLLGIFAGIKLRIRYWPENRD